MDIESLFIIIEIYISSISLYLFYNNKIEYINLFHLLNSLFTFYSLVCISYYITINNLLEWNSILEFFYRLYKKIEKKNISFSDTNIKFF